MNKLASQIIVDILTRKMNLPAGSVWLRDQNRKISNDTGLYIAVGIVNTQFMSSETFIRDGVPTPGWDQLGQVYDETGSPNYDQGPIEDFDQPGQDYDISGQNWDVKQNATTEVNRVQAREDIQIDIFSRSNAAIFRNWEIVTSLQSIYAQQQMELVNFKIFRLPRSMVNTSSAEGGSQINRYTLIISCFVWYVKETLLSTDGGDYYDDFHQRVDTSKTIGSQVFDYDQPDQNYDETGQTFDQPPPIITFEINQQGIEP